MLWKTVEWFYLAHYNVFIHQRLNLSFTSVLDNITLNLGIYITFSIL